MSNPHTLPPMNALRAFEAAGRHLNFRRAADELFVTQGAVAQQVRLLEEHLNVALFIRHAKGVTLTHRGKTYHTEITHAFETIKNATTALYNAPKTVTISASPTFASKLLLPRLPHLITAVPDIELRTIATETIADFDRDEVDIAIRFTKPPLPTHLESAKLFTQVSLPVASPTLIDNQSLPLSLAQLQALPLLHEAHNHWSDFLGVTHALSGIVFNQMTLALDAAVAGQGVALAPKAFIKKELQTGLLIPVNDKTLTLESSYYLVRKRTALPRPSVDAVWQWCLDHLVDKETP